MISLGALALVLALASPSPADVRFPDRPATPPVGTYGCYFYGYNYALESSSLTQIRILADQRMEIVGETVPFRFDPSSSRLTLGGGTFKGASARFQVDSSKKPALVFPRKDNEAQGHKIDVSDTWCYLEAAS